MTFLKRVLGLLKMDGKSLDGMSRDNSQLLNAYHSKRNQDGWVDVRIEQNSESLTIQSCMRIQVCKITSTTSSYLISNILYFQGAGKHPKLDDKLHLNKQIYNSLLDYKPIVKPE